ncbi:Thiaminase-2 [Drechslerella dactyloides]|uniref:Thiaminase-2 n=1 Tax=Drechslerella dactyloides TaxID=74499 RepID=A0AAD6NLB4_DREDA|nr:Thiaminase-2 [Drechslerella dactyloides]
MPPPRVLTIAGSDSSGGAGIEADLKVIAAHGCYGMTAITALTAQNTKGVEDIHTVPAPFLEKSIAAVVEDIGVDVVKMGMLANEAAINTVVAAVKKHSLARIVLDPVMVSTSGSVLLPPPAVAALCDSLIPLATLVTPNVSEAQHLLAHYDHEAAFDEFQDIYLNSQAGLVSLALTLHKRTSTAVLLKGGHVPLTDDGLIARRQEDKAVVMDVLVLSDGAVHIFASPYIDSPNTHGTGCSLASAVACNLALNQSLPDAITAARSYVSGAIAASHSLGHGPGPIDHLHSLYRLPFSAGRFIDYLTQHPRVAPIWDAYVNHPFVQRVAAGTIPAANFKWYLRQDYLFLVQFARAYALLAYKASTISEIGLHATDVADIERETSLHVDYCMMFDIAGPGASVEATEAMLRDTPEAPTTTAYTRYVLDVGASGDAAALAVAVISCSFGYQVAARNRLAGNRLGGTKTVQDSAENVYWSWVEGYANDEYAENVKKRTDALEEMAVRFSVQQVEQLVEVFKRATEMERDFFTAALEAKVDE